MVAQVFGLVRCQFGGWEW